MGSHPALPWWLCDVMVRRLLGSPRPALTTVELRPEVDERKG